MNKQLELVKKFHSKYKAPIEPTPIIPSADRVALRYKLMKDEVDEYKEGVDKGSLEAVAKELADILFATYGTILEHGLEDKMDEIFEEVYRSNMSKTYNEYKMIKGENFVEADVKRVLDKK